MLVSERLLGQSTCLGEAVRNELLLAIAAQHLTLQTLLQDHQHRRTGHLALGSDRAHSEALQTALMEEEPGIRMPCMRGAGSHGHISAISIAEQGCVICFSASVWS